jgi:hypothetical protein
MDIESQPDAAAQRVQTRGVHPLRTAEAILRSTAPWCHPFRPRRAVPVTREGFHAEISAPMLGVVAALFGLVLAFVIVIAYQN